MLPRESTRRWAALAAVLALCAALAAFFWWRSRRPFIARWGPRSRSLVTAARIGDQVALLSKKPHRAGTPANAEVASEIERRFTAAGYKSWSDVREADLWEPVTLRLALTAPAPREIDLVGAPFLAYAPDADVEAPLVWAKTGSAEDYEALRKAGTDARGRIALVSAPDACRAELVLAAEKAGATGLLVTGAPPGGSDTLLKTFRRTGDPRRAKELGLDVLPRIPALALPPAAAGTLRDALTAAAPRLPRVHLTVRGRTLRTKLRNVLASLPGAEAKAAPVLVMSAYDAWATGAGDPGTGAAVVLEAADVLARLYDDGWKPARGVLFALWDGSAPGMFGSTGWLEAHFGTSGLPAAAVLQVDPSAGTAPFSVRATPGLGAVLTSVFASASDPLAVLPSTPALPRFARDAAPFLALTAAPVLEIGSDPPDGVAGSAADTTVWLAGAGDPGSVRSASLTRLVVAAAGALASTRTLPVRYGEIFEYASRELRTIQGRHPAAVGWLPSLLKPVIERLELYASSATAWDAVAASGRGSGRARAFADERALLALDALGVAGDFGRGSLLWGPAETWGCRTMPFAALDAAVRAGNRKAAQAEAEMLLRAFDRARDLLVAAEWAARGRTREGAPRGSERVVRP